MKGAPSEAQTTLGKQKYLLSNAGISVPLPKFCEKLLPGQSAQFRLLIYVRQTTFKRRTSAILNF